MHDIKKILFPVDLSPSASKIVPWVKELAARFDAQIHVLFVARDMAHYAGIGVPYSYIADMEEAMNDGVRENLERFVENELKGTKVVSVYARGYPAEEILSYCRKNDLDMIVIGTHGRKGLEKILFGSVAEHVVKNAPVPVLVVNPYRASKETGSDG